MKDGLRISPSGGCRTLRSMCSQPCVTAPFFPPRSEAIASHPPELANAAINFLIHEAKAHRNRSDPRRLHYLVIAATDLLRCVTDLPITVASIPTEPDLFICRGEPEEVAVRSAQTEALSSKPGIRLSAPTDFNDDNRDNGDSQIL